MNVDVDVDLSGPLFTGEVDGAVSRALNGAETAVGAHLVRQVQQRLDRVLVNPTGRYRAAIDAVQVDGGVAVSDGGVVYGAWLEGTSSRNDRSRFKGYATFRRTMNDVQDQVTDIVDGEVAQMVKRLS